MHSAADTAALEAEVLIIGAGPAGSALGFLLRQAGVDTLIVEAQDVKAKDKLCGGVLVREAQGHVAAVYGVDALAGLGPLRVQGLMLRTFELEMRKEVGYEVLPRGRFDSYCLGRYLGIQGRLLNRACLRGIDAAKHLASVFDARAGARRQIRYSTLVGADGAASMARYLATGRKPRVTPSLQGSIACLGPDVIADLKPSDQGVCWYIPQGEQAVVGSLFHGATSAYCKGRLQDFCAELGAELPRLRGAALPTGDDIQLSADESTYFVGDAAGLIEPFTGSGIHLALESARALAASLAGGEAYDVAMAKTVERITRAAAAKPTANIRACLQIVRSGLAEQKGSIPICAQREP